MLQHSRAIPIALSAVCLSAVLCVLANRCKIRLQCVWKSKNRNVGSAQRLAPFSITQTHPDPNSAPGQIGQLIFESEITVKRWQIDQIFELTGNWKSWVVFRLALLSARQLCHSSFLRAAHISILQAYKCITLISRLKTLSDASAALVSQFLWVFRDDEEEANSLSVLCLLTKFALA